MSQSNLEAIQAVYEGWGTGDWSASLKVMDPDLVFIMPPDLPDAGTYRGLEELAEYMRHFLEPWSHMAIEAQELFDAGDTVVAAIRQQGTGGETGITTDMHYFQIWTFSEGRVIRLENTRDRGKALEAAGRVS